MGRQRVPLRRAPTARRIIDALTAVGREVAMTYRTRRYGSNQRWLLKALREVPYSIARLAEGIAPGESSVRTPADEWSAAEILGYLRDIEGEDVASVRAILRRDGARIEERRAQYGPLERDYRAIDPEHALWDFMSVREDLVWMLRDREDEWERCGEHPYRGPVSLDELVHEITERDLEVMWRLQRVVDALPTTPRPRRRRR